MISADPNILIAGIGNIFLGDDAFGVEVVRRLASRSLPPNVRVIDFGIRGIDLTYALLDECDVAILVDAAPRGHAPGTLYVIQADPITASASNEDLAAGGPLLEAHSMDPQKVLAAVAALGGRLDRVYVVGCEPTPMNTDDEMRMGFSPQVESVLDEAVSLVESVVANIRSGAYDATANAAEIVSSS